MKEYQAFPISNFRVGFDEAVEPWLLPGDAYQTMINAHLYRGILQKIPGYILYANMSYRTITSLGTPDGMTKTFMITLSSPPTTTNFFAFGEIVLGTSSETFAYSSDGVSPIVNLTGTAGGTGTVNMSTGEVSITFNTAPPMSTYSAIFIAWDGPSDGDNAMMGIQQYYNSNGAQEIMIFDQQRVGIITTLSGNIIPLQELSLQGVQEIPHDYYQSAIFTGDGMTTTFTSSITPPPYILAGHPFLPGTLKITQYTSMGAVVGTPITDNGFGGLTGTGVSSGSVNYVTGAYTITFGSAPANLNVFDAITRVYGDLFTGAIYNFFTLTNFQYYAFFTNSVDSIYYYDGLAIHYLNANFTVKRITASAGVPNNTDITKTLHVATDQNRLLLISPTVSGVQEVSSIWWSKLALPLDFTNDESEVADTSEPIRAFSFINTDLVLRFANSERVFRYTGDNVGPFRFDKTNSVWACDAPYSVINYDSWFSSIGRPAITASDGVNVKRADELIPDFTQPSRIPGQTPAPFLNQTSIQICYGQRFDDIKEGWLCYNSSPNAENSITASDNVLAYNYLDGTYATYSFPFSCLGLGRLITVPTWATITTLWEEDFNTWDSYQDQSNALVDLAGDQYDRVFQLNTGNTQTNVAGDEIPIAMSVITKNLNPFIDQGELARLGYIDLFVSANQQSTLRVQFYVNDQLYIDSNDNPAGYYQETQLTFNTKDAMSPTRPQTKVWKRIYVGSVAKTHTIRLYQNAATDFTVTDDQPIYIHGMVLYMKPAGRIFN